MIASDGMRRFLPREPLVPALVLIAVGALLLPWTSGIADIFSSYWPLPVIVVGVVQLLYVAVGRAKEGYLFSGFLLVLGGTGALIIVNGMAHMELSKGWPAFVTFTGLALVGFGLGRPASQRPSYQIPGIAFVVLSAFFFLFSLDLVGVTFSHFVTSWWPIIFVVLGASFLLPRRRRSEDEEPGESDR